MIPTAAILASAGATLVALGVCAWVAKATAELRQEVEELKASDQPARAAVAESERRGPQRMMSALYPERNHPLEIVGRIPAWPAFAVGGLLAFLAVVLGVSGGRPAPEAPREVPAEVASLRAAMDSMTGEVRRLRDSLRLVSEPAAPQLPPAPQLQPAATSP